MRAALYLRISRDRTGEAAGVTRQDEDCRVLAEQLDWPIVEVYRDNDKSAMKRRPEYERMLADIEAGLIDGIIAWHPDRLYRKATDLGPLIEVCRKHDTQIATVRAGTVDLSTATGRLVAGLLANVATYEGEAKSERWKRSILQRREQGQAPGWGPRLFGYDHAGEAYDDEQAVARVMVSKVLDGTSLRAIAKWLDDEGVLTTKGGKWSPQGVRAYLTNPRIAGHSTLNGDTVGIGSWQPVVDDQTFQQLQAAIQVRAGATPPRIRVSLLLGIARCGLCGTSLVSGRDAKGVRRYRCPTPPRADGCGKVSAAADPMEQIVEAYARAKLDDPRVRQGVADLTATAGQNAAEVVALEARLLELEAELDKPGVPVAAITRAMNRTRDQIDSLTTGTPATAHLPRVGEWPDDLARRNRLIRLVVERVQLMPASRPGRNRFENERVLIAPR